MSKVIGLKVDAMLAVQASIIGSVAMDVFVQVCTDSVLVNTCENCIRDHAKRET